MISHSYAASGVDVNRAARFTDFIARMPSPSVSPSIGGFAGGVPIPAGRYRNPVLLSTADGVGTKLLVARRTGDYSSIGIDLVAMCVNDLAVCGADPLLFLDYIACGTLDESKLEQIIGGVAQGCELAGCTLAGGETAEMPDMYGPDEIDLAGFASGIAEADDQLPHLDSLRAGDVVLGLRSSGVHSNGLTLARQALSDADESAWRNLLTPTRIYVKLMANVRHLLKAAAHITGGGLHRNIARSLPKELKASLNWKWPTPEIFNLIEDSGGIPRTEMRAVFNMGIGVALIVAKEDAGRIAPLIGEDPVYVGELVHG